MGRGAAPSPVGTADFPPIERRVRTQLPEKRSSSGDFKARIENLVPPVAGAGVAVNERTALGMAAVTSCVGLLADMVAKLPLYLYQDSPSGPREITNHRAIQLMGKSPSALHTSFELRQLMEIGKGLGGNGYARIYRDDYYVPRSIQWLAPCDVEPQLVKKPNGEAWVGYRVEGVREILTRSDVLHVRGLSRDGVRGLSPIVLLRESISTALAQTAAAGKLMRNGTIFPGYLHTTAQLKTEQLEDLRAEWERSTTGANIGRPPILNGNLDFKQTNGMSMSDAQFLESRRFELQEVARVFRIPAFLIGDPSTTTWGSGIEQMTLGFLNFCLDPHLVAWEQSMAYSLLTDEEIRAGFYFQFDRDELANVALEARANFFQTMRGIGVFSTNDVRAKLGEPLLSEEQGGNNYALPFNNTGGAADAAAAKKSPKPEPAPQP